MIENLGESVDAVLDPVLARSVIKRGRSAVLKLGDKEVEYDEKFRLILQTKLANPHYKPEIAAQTTLINFMITVDGLEEQLLALVVGKERPDLAEQQQELLRQQNEFKITLKGLEDDLMYRLSNAQGDILADIELIENLEKTKVTSKEINEKVEIAKETSKEIALAREVYVPVAVRGALLYFLIDSLWVLDHMYQFSMANFVLIMKKGMDSADDSAGDDNGAQRMGGGGGEGGGGDSLKKRVALLVEKSCFMVFQYISQGLFERHKLIFATQLCMRVLARNGELDPEMFDFLVRCPRVVGSDNPLNEWLSDGCWGAILALSEFEAFDNLSSDVEGSAKRFREWCELERPEDAPLPGDWKKVPEFQRLLIIRCLRSDRMAEALAAFVKRVMGGQYVQSMPANVPLAYQDARPDVPMFFILSPGVDPVKEVEKLGKELDFSYETGKFALVSLGQGQEPVAEKAMNNAHRNGGFVFLQNVHLTPKWTGGYLEERLDKIAAGAHSDFRLFLSAEPSKVIPISVLQQCIKMTNEPPEGLQPNLAKSFGSFNDEFFESSSKPGELKAITFSLSFFHAILLQRKKFGPQGWNMSYPFNIGDLVGCAQVTLNYLEANSRVPWDDLRYIFGEIMYGGHIVNFFDRRLANAYLQTYMKEELLEGFNFYTGFANPPSSLNCQQTMEYVETQMPAESPIAYGLHPNAEIGFRLQQAETMFKNIQELQPQGGSGGGSGMSLSDRAKQILDEISERLPEDLDLADILERAEDRNPYTNVFLQEIERMVLLQSEIRRSLAELDLGLKGDLQMSEAMEALQHSLAMDTVPASWVKRAFPSTRPLSSWTANFIDRVKQLADWSQDLGLPKVTWLSGLFNPQSFLTAVMQTTARRSDWPLDKTVTQVEVTKKQVEEIAAPSRDGAFIHGLVLEGARWDEKSNSLDDSRPKELFCNMPVMLIKAVTVDKGEQRDAYPCPVYKTQLRGATYVFSAGLRSKVSTNRWVMAGVALLMDVVQV